MLCVDPASDIDHQLADLYRALNFSARTNEMIYLSVEHKMILKACVKAIGK
jgi:hypothetical protein